MEIQYGGERRLAAVSLVTLYGDQTHTLLRSKIRNQSAEMCAQSNRGAFCSFRRWLRSRQGQGRGWMNPGGCSQSSATFMHRLLRPKTNPLSADIQPVRFPVFDDVKWHRVRFLVVYMAGNAEQIVGSHVHHQEFSIF